MSIQSAHRSNDENTRPHSGAASSREADLGSAPIGSLLFKLALPAIAAQIINVLYNMVDRMYIGHIPDIGPSALTGVGVTMPIIMCISAFAALAAMGGAPQASILMGKGDKASAEKVLGNCTFMLTVISLVLTALFLGFGRPILLMFGASEKTILYAWNYMKIYVCGTFFVQMALGLNAFINAQGYAKTGMITVAIGALCNIILDPIFIFALNLGIKGAAIATIISQAISAAWVIRFLTSDKASLRISAQMMRPQGKLILSIAALGVSPFIMQVTESLITIIFTHGLQKYGDDLYVGSFTILQSIMQMIFIPMSGFSQGVQPIISYNYGARNPGRVRRAFQVLLMACLAYSLLLWALVQLFPQLFALMFTSDSELVSYASWALRIYMAATGIFGIQIACQQTFVALGNAKISLFLAVLRKIILLIPFIYILPNFFADKAFAVFLAEPVADFLAVCTTATMFAVHFKKSMTALEGKPGV